MIQSTTNPKLSVIKNFYADAKFRKSWDYFVLESKKSIEDLVWTQPDLIDYLLFPASQDPCPIPQAFAVDERLLQDLSTLKTGPKWFAVVKKPPLPDLEILLTAPCLVALDRIQNPANVGAIIRNAAAFEVSAVLLTSTCASPFHPEAIRASAAQVLRCPTLPLDDTLMKSLQTSGFPGYALTTQAETAFKAITTHKNLYIFGSEAHGIEDPLFTPMAPIPMAIPIHPKVDSLNVAVASGIVLCWERGR